MKYVPRQSIAQHFEHELHFRFGHVWSMYRGSPLRSTLNICNNMKTWQHGTCEKPLFRERGFRSLGKNKKRLCLSIHPSIHSTIYRPFRTLFISYPYIYWYLSQNGIPWRKFLPSGFAPQKNRWCESFNLANHLGKPPWCWSRCYLGTVSDGRSSFFLSKLGPFGWAHVWSACLRSVGFCYLMGMVAFLGKHPSAKIKAGTWTSTPKKGPKPPFWEFKMFIFQGVGPLGLSVGWFLVFYIFKNCLWVKSWKFCLLRFMHIIPRTQVMVLVLSHINLFATYVGSGSSNLTLSLSICTLPSHGLQQSWF